MPVEAQVRAEEARRLRPDQALVGEGPEGIAADEGGVELEKRGRPELSFGELATHELIDALIRDADEALDVVLVLRHNIVAELEYVQCHATTLPCPRPPVADQAPGVSTWLIPSASSSRRRCKKSC